ncbi:circadian clock-controlled protein daywake-like [Pieris rapae]|uniref:circadian clock-controlled protein daywake-like n=1 Tax=Pieris rapae TaxID=64459 RepID=UPI001E27B320|nr:circadian clock-controlled protein daywake-like [Pieris rapae]
MLLPFKILVFFAVCAIGRCALFSPCKINDAKCFDAAFADAFPKLLSEDSTLGIGSSDPLHVDLIDGKLSILKYKFFDSTVEGYKRCSIKNVKSNLNSHTLHFELDCPGIVSTGKYELSGRLIVLPVEGEGEYRVTTGKYTIAVDTELKEVQDENSKTYFKIENFKQKAELIEPVVFDFKNLFNGKKDLSDAVHKYANENWKEVTNLVQDPVWISHLKQLIINFNKHLKTAPLEEIFTA